MANLLIRLTLAALGLFALTFSAHADPIFTPIFTAIFGEAILFGTTTIAAVATSIATSLTVSLISWGVSALFAKNAETPTSDELKMQRKSSTQPITYGAGSVLMSPQATVLDEVINGWSYFIGALFGHRISGITGAYVDSVQQTLVAGMWTGAPGISGDDGYTDKMVTGNNGRYNGRYRFDWRLGTESESPYSWIISRISGGASSTSSAYWNSSCLGNGVASVALVITKPASENFNKEILNPSAPFSMLCDLAPMWDPREPSQDPNNSYTWSYAPRNCAIQLIWFWCFCPYGPQKDYRTAILPLLDDWIEQINICDDLVPKKSGGTEPRFHASWVASTENENVDVLRELLKACDGWLHERGDGATKFRAGLYTGPEIMITDSDIAGVTFYGGTAAKERYNRLMCSYSSPDHGYETVQIGPFDDASNQSRAGKIRSTTLELKSVQSNGQASRVSYGAMEFIKSPIRGVLYIRKWSANAENAIDCRDILISSNKIKFLNGLVIRNTKYRRLATQGLISIEFNVVPVETINDYSAAIHELKPQDPQSYSDDELTVISDFEVVAEKTSTADSEITSLKCSFDNPNRSDLEYIVRWRLANDGSGFPGVWVNTTFSSPPGAVSGRITLRVPDVPSGTTIHVAMREHLGAWTDPYVIVSTTVTGTAPGTPTINSLSIVDSLASLTCTAPNSANCHHLVLYRAPAGSDFEAAVDASDPVLATANQTVFIEDSPGVGAWDWWLVAANEYNVTSTPAGPVTGTIS
ncbi:hypothetical protein [Pleomorphomonas sp. PLEO]|uniref:hypothetical protein n=1 Tax=Pleomorphomonas sp. PLEO TaxID=3239306 RepID=UPI00351DDCDC